MKILSDQLEKIKKEQRTGLMTHVVLGYPTLSESIELVKTMCSHGVDFIELQIPFSDPFADGPIIMHANDVALSQNVTADVCLSAMKQLSESVTVPLLFMAYFHSIFSFGTERFCRLAKKAGAQGLIVPDIPLDEEEVEHFLQYCQKYNIPNIRVLSPSMSEERLKLNAKYQEGFIYCTSRRGVTGKKAVLDADFSRYLKQVKNHFTIPLAVGFGISTAQEIHALQGQADIAVVGTAILQTLNKSGLAGVAHFLDNLTAPRP